MKTKERCLVFMVGLAFSWFLFTQFFSLPVMAADSEKTVTATFISYNGANQVIDTKTQQIGYGDTALIEIPALSEYPGWKIVGWVFSPDDSSGSFGPDQIEFLSLSEDRTFYGLYERQVTLDFLVNGDVSAPEKVSCQQFTNSFDPGRTYGGQIFKLPPWVSQSGMEFAGWTLNGVDGTMYPSGWAVIDLQGTDSATMYEKGKPIQYTIRYNYGTNGGYNPDTGETMTLVMVNSGTLVNQNPLEPLAAKAGDGWVFVGWNKDPNEHEPGEPFEATQDEDLYAIYMREVTATFIDYSGMNKMENPQPVKIYNNESLGDVPFPQQNTYGTSGSWLPAGWTTAKGATAEPIPESWRIGDDAVFYGLYRMPVVIKYNTDGGTPVPPDDIGTACYNSYNMFLGGLPITLPSGVKKDGYKFDGWLVSGGTNKYAAGAVVNAGMYTTFIAQWREAGPTDEETIQYVAVHRVDPVTSTPENGWSANNPPSFLNEASWRDITDTLDAGSSNRLLAVAYTFNYNTSPAGQDRVVQSLENMLEGAKLYNVPVLIHLDGANSWYNSNAGWNWWNDSENFSIPWNPMVTNHSGATYSEDNIYNVEHFDWGMTKDTAVKLAWRNWGAQDRLNCPPPNLASEAFRDTNRAAFQRIMPIIVNWYNDLADDKKYLFAGVVLGQETSPWAGSYYYQYPDDAGNLVNGNDLYDMPKSDDPPGSPWSNKVRPLGYAAAQTLWERNLRDGIHDDRLQAPHTGDITPATVGYIINDYFEFLIAESIQYGIPANKLITHGLAGYGHPMEAAISKVDGVIPGWTVFIGQQYEKGKVDLDVLGNRPWAVSEFPSDQYVTLADLESKLNHGNCYCISIKSWESRVKGRTEVINALNTVLGGQ